MSPTSEHLSALRIDRSAPPQRDPRRRRWLLTAIAAVLLIAAGALLFGLRTRIVEVTVVPVEAVGGEAPAASVLDASGYVIARRQATVSSKVTGRVEAVLVEEGMAVEEGEILARLDDSLPRRALALAEAQLAAARSGVDEAEALERQAALAASRVQRLFDSGVASQAELDRTVAERDAQTARVAAARDQVDVAARQVALRQQDVEDCLIRAPFAGVAISKNAQPGEIISPMSAGGGFTRTGITTVVDMDSLEIEVDVNESFIERVEDGQPVTASLDAYPEWRIPAHVITTVPAADRQKATVKVRIGFDELGDPRLLPDMGAKVSFQASRAAEDTARQRLQIPAAALQRDGATPVVYRVVDGRLERRAVTTAGSGERLDVVAGLAAGDQVVIAASGELSDGAKVRVRATEE